MNVDERNKHNEESLAALRGDDKGKRGDRCYKTEKGWARPVKVRVVETVTRSAGDDGQEVAVKAAVSTVYLDTIGERRHRVKLDAAALGKCEVKPFAEAAELTRADEEKARSDAEAKRKQAEAGEPVRSFGARPRGRETRDVPAEPVGNGGQPQEGN